MTGSCFQRFTPRDAMDIAIASASSQVTLEPGTGRIDDVAIALGAVAPTPMRAGRAEDALLGREPTPELLAQAGTLAASECSPIDDLRGSATPNLGEVRDAPWRRRWPGFGSVEREEGLSHG